MLIPPQRANLVRYHGVFAPNSKLRPQILPRFEGGCEVDQGCCEPAPTKQLRPTRSTAGPTTCAQPTSGVTPAAHDSQTTADLPIRRLELPQDPYDLPLSLLGPAPDPKTLLPIRERRLDWATLLKKVHAIDVLDCPRCPERLTVLAAISDPPVVRKILEHLKVPTTTPTMAPARAPPQQDFDFSQA